MLKLPFREGSNLAVTKRCTYYHHTGGEMTANPLPHKISLSQLGIKWEPLCP